MKILFEIGHPAHVHLFRHVIRNLEAKGHKIKIAVREREDMVVPLLDHYGFEYELMYPNAKGMLRKALTMLKNDFALLKIARRFGAEIFVSMASPYSAHVSYILRKPHICLTDTEDAGLQLKLMVPFTESILTPDCFLRDFPEKKHIRYPGYHELAYLHPHWFKPDPSILEHLGVKKDEKYVIMRFSAWDAAHDLGQYGFRTDEERLALVKELEKYAKVFISSEIPLKGELEKRRIKIPIHRIHDALYYASLYVGDGHKMAAESGMLGTPSILLSTRWDGTGNFRDFVEKYGIVEAFKDIKSVKKEAITILKNGRGEKEKWRHRSREMLKEKIDFTAFLIYFIENYPESHKSYMEEGNVLFNKFKGVDNGELQSNG